MDLLGDFVFSAANVVLGNEMGRIKRADAAGAIYHMLNRGNRRATIVEKEADVEAFERILVDAVAKFDLELFSNCVLSNHWRLVVRPQG